MSAVWVACLDAHFGSLSRTPRRLTRVSFKIKLFLLFFPFISYLCAFRLSKCSGEDMHASLLKGSQRVEEVVDVCGKPCTADHVVLGWGEVAMQMWTGTGLEAAWNWYYINLSSPPSLNISSQRILRLDPNTITTCVIRSLSFWESGKPKSF